MPLGSLIGGIIGGGLSLFGAKKSSDAMADQSRLTQGMLNEAKLRSFGVSGPNGIGATFNPYGVQGAGPSYATQGSTLSPRLMEAFQRAGYANTPQQLSPPGFDMSIGDRLEGQQNVFDRIGAQYLKRGPGNVTGAAQGSQNALSAFAGTGTTPGDFSGLLAGAYGGMDAANNQLGAVTPLAQQGYSNMGQYLQEVAGGSEQARSRTLDLLRQQAQPYEERAFSGLQDNLFSTGRMGSTGGALQTEAFARGLGEADLSRQLAANQEGRNFQNNAMGLAGASGNLSDSLLQNAFGNFQNFAGLANDVENSRFAQNIAGGEMGFDQLQQLFSNNLALGTTNQAVRDGNLAQAMASFGFGNSLNDAALPYANLALQAEQARSNAALGQGSVSNQVIPGGAYSGQFMSGIGGALSNFSMGGGFDFLGGLFNNKPAPSSGGGGQGYFSGGY
jgi:hypothetical protein